MSTLFDYVGLIKNFQQYSDYYVSYFCTNNNEKGEELLFFAYNNNRFSIYRVNVIEDKDHIVKLELVDKNLKIVDKVIVNMNEQKRKKAEFINFLKGNNKDYIDIINNSYNYVASYDNKSNMIEFIYTNMN
ncbi:hypothetical protein [Clostridium sediminicola]|uniref:hypothetical protein n=1 Tax=Clostridium sediminicola TaxID=3114879 RepID=UPI003D18155D